MSLERDKKTLVISLGDSWTFGDSLGTIADHISDDYVNNHDDHHARFTQCYGRLIADALDADWYNFGYCGGGNISILTVAFDWLLNHHTLLLTQENYKKIKTNEWPESVINGLTNLNIYKELKEVHCRSNWSTDQIDLSKYDNVYAFITLTETGRDYCNIKSSNYTIPPRVEDYLQLEESYVYNLIHTLKSQSKYKIIVGRNFTVDLPTTTNSALDVKSSWIELNYQFNKLNNQGSSINLVDILKSGPVSGIGLHSLSTALEFENFKEFFVNQVNSVDKCWTWLRNNPLNHNKATCHPTKESHRLWAEYLLSYIK